MAQELIQWNTGGGNIVVNYSGSGNDTVTVGSDTDNEAFIPRSQSITVRTTAGASISRTVTVTQSGKVVPVGTIYNFAYTGTVQEVTLSAGTYKLQVWGAQGGQNPAYSTYGIISVNGGKGGYSEGILTLTSPTTLYIFVGGQPSTSSTNGGWNGGGGGTGTSTAGTPTTATYGLGYTKIGRGGGATDIALTTSIMSYSDYRTNRSSASLLSRFIVAGGGSGGAACYQEIQTTTTTWVKVSDTISLSSSHTGTWNGYSYSVVRSKQTSGTRQYVSLFRFNDGDCPLDEGHYKAVWSGISEPSVSTAIFWSGSPVTYIAASTAATNVTEVTREFDFDYDSAPSSSHNLRFQLLAEGAYTTASLEIFKQVSTTSTITNNDSQVGYAGGGVEGVGYASTNYNYYGSQDAAGNRGDFGLGANQVGTSYRYVSPCGGGGWYGGGNGYLNATSDPSLIYSGGGSGFVNVAANAQYRPSGYTGLELDSGATYAGNTSFPSTSGSTETGHSGDGYARITCIDPNSLVPLTFDILGSGTIGWKTSNSSLTRTIQYKKNNGSWTNITSSTSGVTISVSNGDVVQFRGSSTAFATSSYYNYFTATCNFNVRGNIMSMFSNSGFESATTIPASYALKGLFYGNTYLKDASALLMPATTLTTYCYQNMFYGCTNMTGVPALPATTTQGRCYYRMFYNCSNITTAPVLNAATVATYGYYQMFYGCSKLNYIKCLATSISASNAVNGWVNGVAATGTFVKKSTMSSWSTGTSGIPSGWTVQNAS